MSPPRLQPYHTTFDLDMGTPGKGVALGQHMTVWPMSPGNNKGRLYPPIPRFDEPCTGPSTNQTDEDVPMPGALYDEPAPSAPSTVAFHTIAHTPARLTSSAKTETPKPAPMPDIFSPMPGRRSTPRNGQFLFGSPLPQNKVTKKDFGEAAAAVLEEMNRRLAAAGVRQVDEKVASSDSISAGPSNTSQANVNQQTSDAQSVQDRFAKAHEDAFAKMDSIATHYAAKRCQPQASAEHQSKKRKSDVLGHGPAPGAKRQSNAAGARVISNGVRKKMGVPGAFGDNDDEENEDGEDAGNRRASKRMRVTDEQGVHKGRRVSIVPPPNSGGTTEINPEEEKKREAMRKKLEMNKARRRSSRGRVSVGGKGVNARKFSFLRHDVLL